MERIYRGYPQAFHAMERSGDLMPYMLYRERGTGGTPERGSGKTPFPGSGIF